MNTGLLACPFASTTHSFACSTLLTLLHCAHLFARLLTHLVFSVMEWSRLCWQNFSYLSKSVQFLMLNKTRVVPSLKKILGYPGRGCFCQNFHKKSQNFFLLESALCWTLYREKIWSSASFHQISSKSMQQ